MIHGTWGWKGDWWRPRGAFHEFIRSNHRPALYSKATRFSWSGLYRKSDRQVAAQDFREWADEVEPHSLQTVFAHSYGGEVAARAVLLGARLTELILLSVPVTNPVKAAAESGLRVVDVRLKLDPVLALARKRQRLPTHPKITPVVLEKWRRSHGATHEERVWRDEDIARRGGV